MNDVVEIAKQIEKHILALHKEKDKLRSSARHKAEASTNYEKKLAQTILQLKNGSIEEFEGEPVGQLPATTAEKVARGICWREKLDADLAEAGYKALIVSIQAIEAALNGYQSLYKYLKEEV